ncbi:MAG: ATP-binding protein [Lachnospiraceae bacterium]|nr:ATP-binding protein [Lachnospiraceae bacterium]
MISRNAQREYLEQFYKRADSQLIVMYGARGAGKTRLLKEFIQNKAYCYYQARPCSDREQAHLWSMECRENGMQPAEYPEYDELAEGLLQTGHTKEKLVVVIDEFQHMVRGGKSFIQSMVKLLHHTWDAREVLIILCSSCIGWVENSMVTRMGEAAFEISGFLKIRDLGFTELLRYFEGSYTAEECLGFYSILGGIPGLWKYVDRKQSIRDNICRLLLEDEGILQREAREMVDGQLRESSVYHAILAAIAAGSIKLNDLYHDTGFSRAKISVYLKNLMELEIVEKVFSFDSEGRENTQKGIYRISNHLVRFYFRFLYPHLSALSMLEPEVYYDRYIAGEIAEYAAGFFGKVCTQYIEQENQKGNLPIRFERSGEWVGKKGSLDLVAQNEEGRTLICGCDYGMAPMTYERFEEWMDCVRAARLSADEIYLFAREKFEERLQLLAKENEKVHLVAWKNLYI